MIPCLLLVFLTSFSQAGSAAERVDDKVMAHSVEELRSSIGRWNVSTEFLNEDGTVAKAVTGTYGFSWVVSDRVVSGRSDIPELNQSAGILFYVNEKKKIIEMVSVGEDGNLWTMTGPLGGETRHSQEYKGACGAGSQLRFTRYNVTSDAFESKMEYTDDGGKTWKPGNHQTYRRAAHDAATAAEPSVKLPGELARVLSDYEAGWRARDAAALARLFVEDGFVLPGGRPPVRGRAAVQQYYTGSGGPLVLRAIAFATEGNAGYIIGGYARQAGEADIGKFTLTLRRDTDRRWLIVSDMDNSNTPPR